MLFDRFHLVISRFNASTTAINLSPGSLTFTRTCLRLLSNFEAILTSPTSRPITSLKMPGYATRDLANGAHLVGSVPLSSTLETFCKMMVALPHRLRRVPDGGTGKRNYFIRCQDSVSILSPFIMYPHDLAGSPFDGQDISIKRGGNKIGAYWLRRCGFVLL